MRPVDTRRVRRLLRAKGCELVGTEGSHEKWRSPNGLTATIVAGERQQSPGLLAPARPLRRGVRSEVAGERHQEVTSYTAHCEWDGHNWTATVEELPGGFTQAKRLELIPGRVVEVVKLMDGTVIEPADVTLVPHLADDVADDADAVARLRADLEEIQRALADRQPRVIRRLRATGLTIRDIGTIVGLSPQRVHQLLRDRRRA